MKHFICTILLSAILLLSGHTTFAQRRDSEKNPVTTEVWEPKPKIVTPAEKPTDPPSDAIVLFDGKNLDQWVSMEDGSAAKWKVSDGAVTVEPKTGAIRTKKEFGDIQLHIEWRAPAVTDPAKETSQGRGNSGIFLQSAYEVQVLDNYENETYSNGQASSIYKQHIPLANACKKPGEWQTYDIIYTAPRFNDEGRVVHPAYVTVIHNGVLTQNHVALWGPSMYIGLPVYKKHGKAPLFLQDHNNLVSYRNIWLREL